MVMALQWQEIGEVGSLLGLLCGGDGDLPGPEWLHECPLSLTGSGMAAIAMGSTVAWRRMGEGMGDDVVVRNACGEGVIDTVTALQWVEAELSEEGEGSGSGGWERVGHRDAGGGRGHGGGGSARRRGEGGGFKSKEMLVVGCASGTVRAYMADGRLIVSQAVHDTGVRAFKLKGFNNIDSSQVQPIDHRHAMRISLTPSASPSASPSPSFSLTLSLSLSLSLLLRVSLCLSVSVSVCMCLFVFCCYGSCGKENARPFSFCPVLALGT